jgi:cellulose synthase/poly-beta-1,6-N-acetylglucosamine synthase-like glycosyltransferase
MNVTGYDSWAPTCNIAYPRELLEQCEGFDERFTTAWGEDTDLALRAKAAGAAQAYVPEALVWHAVLPRTLAGALSDGVRRSNIHVVLRRHPEHRQALDLGVFTKRNHAFVLPALVGLALIRRRPLLGALLVVPYLAHYFDPSVRWSPFRLAYWVTITMARRALLDAVELAAMAVSSARYRTLAL